MVYHIERGCGMRLEIKHLTKNYGNVRALSDVTVTLEEGIYGLLGPNGAGKSTLINLLTDNVRREKGEILWEGREIRQQGKKYRSILGYMPQQQGYYEDFSAGAFLMYMAHLKGMGRKEAEEKVSELLSVVNLEDCRLEKVGALSGGMKQRLLLAQALLNDPKLLILDEPTAGVDPQERIRIRNFISEIAADRIVILATHIVSDVESIAKEILLMKQGKLIRQEAPFGLLEEIGSYVHEIQIPQNRLPDIRKRCVVSNLRHTAEGLAVKIIAEHPPEEFPSSPAIANLEDVYLYYFDKE